MEKSASWRDIPSSLRYGGRSLRALRAITFVILILVLFLVYGSSSSSSSTTAAAGSFSGDHKPLDEPNASGGGGGGSGSVPRPSRAQQRLIDAAGNATLGFGSIQFINLPGRFDRLDAATLQAWLSGIDITETRGVLAAEINDVGMPPEHGPQLKQTEKGCWRAHANIWSQMLRDKTPAVLILESDAAWDVEVRESMRLLNQHFTHLLGTVQSTPIPNRSFLARPPSTSSASPRSAAAASPHPDDPWQSTHWDLLSLGQCFDEPAHDKDISGRYPDPHVAPGIDYAGSALGAERVVRLSGGIVCTTAYAVSQTGAAKLLLRSAVNLDNPVDLVMRRLIHAGDLVTYSVIPTVFAQWEYLDHIGMRERGANSDIRSPDSDGAPIDLTGWETVKKTGSVWRKKEGHPSIAFKDMALERAWALILGETTLERSQYDEAAGN
ncbi:hypothetical protein MY11210_009551 [Beauveria gryllotalpidicola]